MVYGIFIYMLSDIYLHALKHLVHAVWHLATCFMTFNYMLYGI